MPGSDEPEFENNALVAAYIRNELPLVCDCEAGYVSTQVSYEGLTVTILMDDKVRHPLCEAREGFDPAWIEGSVPPKHAEQRLYSLASWGKSPLPETTQLLAIGRIPSLADGLHGWLMVGDPGTSKTTYAAAAIIDWLTFRASEAGIIADGGTPYQSALTNGGSRHPNGPGTWRPTSSATLARRSSHLT